MSLHAREDGGGARFSEQDVIQLREYLFNGGFIFATDSWGTRARAQWEAEIGRVLPRGRPPAAASSAAACGCSPSRPGA